MISIPWLLPLAKETAIVEEPITSDKVLESLESYHPAAVDGKRHGKCVPRQEVDYPTTKCEMQFEPEPLHGSSGSK